MRGPARAAGLSELQQFLETGFETFREMKGAHDFMAIVDERERVLSSALFGAAMQDAESGNDPCTFYAAALHGSQPVISPDLRCL